MRQIKYRGKTDNGEWVYGFEDYMYTPHRDFWHTAIQSLHSWLRSHGFEPGEVVVLKINSLPNNQIK